MNDVKFRKIRTNILSDNKKRLEFNYIDWNGKIKFDLRKWGENGTQPYKGITFETSELPKLLDAINKALISPKNNTVKYTAKIQNSEIRIFDLYGEFDKKGDWLGLVTYIDWGSGAKYDIRSWKEDFSKCSKGVTLLDAELTKLKEVLIKEIDNIANKESSVSFNDINDDLFI